MRNLAQDIDQFSFVIGMAYGAFTLLMIILFVWLMIKATK